VVVGAPLTYAPAAGVPGVAIASVLLVAGLFLFTGFLAWPPWTGHSK
jgi:hypothetical protein